MPKKSRRVRVVTKGELDERVAIALGKKRRDVSLITETLLSMVTEELAEMNAVHLNGLGELCVSIRRGRRASHAVLTKGTFGRKKTEEQTVVRVEKKYYVIFKKAVPLALAIRVRQGVAGKVVKVMEKLGVDEQRTENEKKASDGCPLCGAKVERHGNVLACPTHGTEPFETKRH